MSPIDWTHFFNSRRSGEGAAIICEVIILEIRKNLVHEVSEGFDCMTPSMTSQEFIDECNVNNILRNYVNTGVLTHTVASPPLFGDFTQMPSDYGEALAVIEKSREEFAALPSDVRERFDNNPKNLIKFIADGRNYEEALKLGLVNKRPDPEVKE